MMNLNGIIVLFVENLGHLIRFVFFPTDPHHIDEIYNLGYLTADLFLFCQLIDHIILMKLII